MPVDTFSVDVGTDDQKVAYTDSGTYPPASGLNRTTNAVSLQVQRSLSAGLYSIAVVLLAFDTSLIPDSNLVTAATLRIQPDSRGNVDALSLTAGYYAWDGSSASDLTGTPETNAHAGTLLSSFSLGADNDLALINPSNISKTGKTRLRLHVSQRAGNAAPTGVNMLQFVAFEHATLPASRLIVTHEPTTTPSTLMVGGVGI